MGGEDHGRVGRDLLQLLDEHRALGLQVLDDGPVVHDLVPHIDRRAIEAQRLFDDLDGAVDPRAKSAWAGEQDGQFRPGHWT